MQQLDNAAACEECAKYAELKWRFCPKCAKPLTSVEQLEAEAIERVVKAAIRTYTGADVCGWVYSTNPHDRIHYHITEQYSNCHGRINYLRETPIYELLSSKVKTLNINADSLAIKQFEPWEMLYIGTNVPQHEQEYERQKRTKWIDSELSVGKAKLFCINVAVGLKHPDTPLQFPLIFTEAEIFDKFPYLSSIGLSEYRITKTGYINVSRMYDLFTIFLVYRNYISHKYFCSKQVCNQ